MKFSASFRRISISFVAICGFREPRMPSKDSDFSGYWSDKPS